MDAAELFWVPPALYVEPGKLESSWCSSLHGPETLCVHVDGSKNISVQVSAKEVMGSWEDGRIVQSSLKGTGDGEHEERQRQQEELGEGSRK